MALELGQSLRQKQMLAVSPQQLQGLKLLAKSLPELRAEIFAEMARNPAIEDVERPLETSLDAIEDRRGESAAEPDYPDEESLEVRNFDEEAAERRQAFFDSQVGDIK